MKIVLIFKSKLDPNNGPNEQIFVEAHDENGKSIDVGEWAADGEYESLTIDCDALSENDHARLVQKLDDCTAIAISPGNADVNDYLRGMANGLLLAQSIFKGDEPKFIEATAVERLRD